MTWSDVAGSILLLLRQPILLGELVLVAGVLIGSWGRPLGIPLMFWNERAGTQFVAGLASNLLAAEVLFVVGLAGEATGRAAPATFGAVAVWGWLVVQAIAIGWPRPRSSRIRDLDARGQPRDLVGQAHRPWPFAVGLFAAAAVVFGMWAVGPGLVRRAGLDELIAQMARWSEPVTGTASVDRPDLHALAAILFLVALVGATSLAYSRARPPSALSVCALLSLLAAAVGFVSFWFRSIGLALLVLAGLLAWAGKQKYKIRLADLRAKYTAPPKYGVAHRTGSSGLRADQLATAGDAPTPACSKAPIFLVCTSGGGIRAATWTAAVLGRLDAIPGFRENAWMITGASGGMVGAAAWVASLRSGPVANGSPAAWKALLEAVGADSLAPTVRALAFGDVPRTFMQSPNPKDRGSELQGAWAENLARLQARLDEPLASLIEGERAGHFPSLVFSPVVVEDGRRLLVCNLDLTSTVAHRSTWLLKDGSTAEGTSSRSAFHARDFFGHDLGGLTLATAARLSASFPYVSPAANLPTDPPRRAVDAGYYDNYGVELACSWLTRCLEHNRDWIREHVSGVLLLQIRDSEVSRTLGGDPPEHPLPEDAKEPGRVARALQGLTSPPEAVLSTRQSTMVFRNDAQLEAVSSLYRARLGEDFVVTSIFELKADVSLSWSLSSDERGLIEKQVESPGITEKLEAIRVWLARPRG